MPNMPVGIGVGASWRGVGLNLAYAMEGKGNKGSTQALDLQYHFYGRRWISDGFLQIYSGFFVREKNEEGLQERTYRSDIALVKVGGFVAYAFNHQHFSSRAAFGQGERQLRSAGSWLLGGSAYYTHIVADSAITGKRNGESRNFLIGPNVGYAYTWVFKSNVFISGSMSTGVHVGFENMDGKKANFYPLVVPRIVWGYNAQTWSIGLSGIYNGTYISYANGAVTSLNSGEARVTFIKRFHMNSKFLDKITFYRE